MIQRFAAAAKRLHISRFLLIIALVLALLVASFVLRGFIPTGWVQQFRTGLLTLPNRAVQTPVLQATVLQRTLPAASPTEPVGVVSGLNTAGSSSPTPGFSATPSAASSKAASTGLITVITLTPSAVIRAADSIPTSPLPVSPDPGQATLSPATATVTLPASPTPLPSETAGLTHTLTPSPPVPALAPELSPLMVNIRTELQNLVQMMEVTRVMLQTFAQGQPTGEEMIVLRAQAAVVTQRMEKLAVQLQAAQAASETFGADARISPGQVRDLLLVMREALAMLQSVLAGPGADSIKLAQALPLMDQLQGMMEQVQRLAAARQNAGQSSSLPAAPTITSSPTLAPVVTITPTPANGTYERLSQLQAMLEEMQVMLRQMQSLLQQLPK